MVLDVIYVYIYDIERMTRLDKRSSGVGRWRYPREHVQRRERTSFLGSQASAMESTGVRAKPSSEHTAQEAREGC